MKDEAYWIRWLENHDTEAMKAEVVDLGNSIHDGAEAGTLSEEQILIRGRRQAELVHELLEFYDVPGLAEDLGFTVDQVMGLNEMQLANRGDELADPSTN